MSPESFYQGSVANSAEEALAIARRQLEEGADIIDIGGMSSAPYKQTQVSEEVEIERILGAVKLIKKETSATVSVDTFRSKVADKALSAGADIINDITGLRYDEKMAKVISDHSASVILMAKEDYVDKEIALDRHLDPIRIVKHTLKDSLNIALRAGISSDQIAVDPGIGFFRRQSIPWYEWDLLILRSIERLFVLGYPIVIGVSRKSFIGETAGVKRPEDRLAGSLAAEAIAILNGADAIRTHDVKPSLQAAVIAEQIRKRMIGDDNSRCYKTTKAGESELSILPAIDQPEDFLDLLEIVQTDKNAYHILSKKSVHRNVLMLNIPTPLLLIMKQEMLSLGGDVATPKEAITGRIEYGNAVLIGSIYQLEKLCQRLAKMEINYLRERGMLTPKELAKSLRELLRI